MTKFICHQQDTNNLLFHSTQIKQINYQELIKFNKTL